MSKSLWLASLFLTYYAKLFRPGIISTTAPSARQTSRRWAAARPTFSSTCSGSSTSARPSRRERKASFRELPLWGRGDGYLFSFVCTWICLQGFFRFPLAALLATIMDVLLETYWSHKANFCLMKGLLHASSTIQLLKPWSLRSACKLLLLPVVFLCS